MKRVAKFNTYYFTVVFSLFLTHPECVSAQSGGGTGYANRIGHNPIGLSMGNSLSAWTDLETSSLYNPALATVNQNGVNIHPSTSLMSFDRSLHSLEVGFPLPPSASLSLTLQHFSVSGIDGRTPSGYPSGTLRTSDFQIAGAFGLSISEQLSIGIGIKWNRADYHQDISAVNTVGLDMGLLYKLSSIVTFSLVAQDLFASYSWDTGPLYGIEQGQSDKQPFGKRYKAGSHIKIREDFDITSEVELRSQRFTRSTYVLISDFGEPFLRESKVDEVNTSMHFRQGIAWEYHPRFTWRAGLETTDLRLEPEIFWSTGFSVYPPNLSFNSGIHYAYRNEPGKGSSIHSVSVTFSF